MNMEKPDASARVAIGVSERSKCSIISLNHGNHGRHDAHDGQISSITCCLKERERIFAIFVVS